MQDNTLIAITEKDYDLAMEATLKEPANIANDANTSTEFSLLLGLLSTTALSMLKKFLFSAEEGIKGEL